MRTVLILADTLNRRHIKVYNPNARSITPNIDQFAEESITFDNHFMGSAPCMPARRDIFTGRTQFLERGWGGVEPFDITLPETLRKNNIFTHMTTDHNHYFEIGGENYCYLFNTWNFHRGQEYDPWVSRIKQPLPTERYGKQSPQYELNKTQFKTDADYSTPKTFQSACEWIEANSGCDDFFLMVECFDPHEPFDCPKEFLDMYEDNYIGKEFNWTTYAHVTEPDDALQHLENCYMATLTMMDKWFGQFMQSLKDNHMYDDTMIILTTDHGHMLGEHGFTGKNYMHAYNEVAHIPLMVRLPNGMQHNTRSSSLTQNIDLMPTILQHHGLSVPDRVKGMNLFGEDIKSRAQVIYGWFGRAVNVYDGKYTYFRAPKSPENQPCYQYCAIPSTIWRYFGEDYADDMEMGRYLPYTNYPVFRIPVMQARDIYGDISYVMKSEIYDIQNDYAQEHPISDSDLEQDMCCKLIKAMVASDSPKEQFERLGLRHQS